MRRFLVSAASIAFVTTSAFAQTAAPSNTMPSTAPTATTVLPAQNLAGQGKWRASKLMGVDIYGPDKVKVGDVNEVIFDKTGKIDMIVIEVGGFLGLGAKDVAVPFAQITWSDQPMEVAAPAPTTTTGTTTSTASPPAMNTTAAATPKAPEMYPDHGMIAMTREQLTSAPAVSYSN